MSERLPTSEPPLIAVCADCDYHWYPMEHANEICPGDTTENGAHRTTAYVRLDRVISYRTDEG